MKAVLLLCALVAVAHASLSRPEDAAGKFDCKNVDNAKEKALIDPAALTRGNVASAEIWSSKTKKFTITSFKDADKKEDQACLTGHSWLSNEKTDQHPMLTAEFGKSLKICGVVYSGRPDWKTDKALEFNMKLSGDNKNWAIAHDRFNGDKEDFVGLGKDEDAKLYKTCIFSKPIDANFMKLTSKKLVGGAALAVRIGFLYDCKYTDGCKTNHCQNGGKCVSQEFGTFKCECTGGATGKLCEKKGSGAPAPAPAAAAAPASNSASNKDAYRVGCTFEMQDHRLDQFGIYEPIPFICPPANGCNKDSGKIWGSPHYYTTDSPLCKTAIQTFGPDHLKPERVIIAYKVGKHQDYWPSERHGIKSLKFDREPWDGYTWDKNVVDALKAKGRK